MKEPNRDFVFQGDKISVGDEVVVEQAWEDTTGAYHDEPAKVRRICKNGRIFLDFYEAAPKVKRFLRGCDFRLDED